MALAIELDGVGKRYRLGEHHGTGMDLRETLARLTRRLRGRPAPPTRDFWSLRDVSFGVEEGSALGIIGANGAGKSTLLKIINNITTPTVGESRTRGRIGSLLEVGTGFHGELTGIENTFLNGAILGMTKREVSARLDEIIEFAGLQQFMDTPVKRYSSGMYLRLGFAIAAHMEAEILLVDEVLAVGDVEFQRRCLGKMNEVEASGRTVLFVSHNMDAIARLCPTTIWLDKGRLRSSGATDEVIAQYMQDSATRTDGAGVQLEIDPTASAQVIGAALVDDDGISLSTLTTRTSPWMQVDILANEGMPGLDVSFQVTTRGGIGILEEALGDVRTGELSKAGRYRVACHLPAILTPGEYTISIWLGSTYENLEQHENVLSFTVEGDDLGRLRRLITIPTEWRTARLDDHLVDP
jgi:ABC-2 type transport system ATP-binding protein/lipopolysaccharide transport system ATP-binding protein